MNVYIYIHIIICTDRIYGRARMIPNNRDAHTQEEG